MQIFVPCDKNVNKAEPASLADLQQGHDIFQNHCVKCHKLPKPAKHTKDDWQKIHVKMAPKAKLNTDQPDLVFK